VGVVVLVPGPVLVREADAVLVACPGAGAVREGVNIAWRVNAAAVCTSPAAGGCSPAGKLQARIVTSKTELASLIFNVLFIP